MGEYRLNPKIGYTTLEIIPGKEEIACGDLAVVADVCDKLISAVQEGELDGAI
jgi:hypothetical protein